MNPSGWAVLVTTVIFALVVCSHERSIKTGFNCKYEVSERTVCKNRSRFVQRHLVQGGKGCAKEKTTEERCIVGPGKPEKHPHRGKGKRKHQRHRHRHRFRSRGDDKTIESDERTVDASRRAKQQEEEEEGAHKGRSVSAIAADVGEKLRENGHVRKKRSVDDEFEKEADEASDDGETGLDGVNGVDVGENMDMEDIKENGMDTIQDREEDMEYNAKNEDGPGSNEGQEETGEDYQEDDVDVKSNESERYDDNEVEDDLNGKEGYHGLDDDLRSSAGPAISDVDDDDDDDDDDDAYFIAAADHDDDADYDADAADDDAAGYDDDAGYDAAAADDDDAGADTDPDADAADNDDIDDYDHYLGDEEDDYMRKNRKMYDHFKDRLDGMDTPDMDLEDMYPYKDDDDMDDEYSNDLEDMGDDADESEDIYDEQDGKHEDDKENDNARSDDVAKANDEFQEKY